VAYGRGRWIEITLDRIPAIGGTYAIFRGAQLLYIGSAHNIRARLQDHGFASRRGKLITKFGHVQGIRIKVAVELRFGLWLTRESRLIKRLKPPMNAKVC
jgi:excinuclease UvrABC nuclease subunit